MGGWTLPNEQSKNFFNPNVFVQTACFVHVGIFKAASEE